MHYFTIRGPGSGRAQGSGFTLIELIITVAIVAVLAAVAAPAYFEQVRKSRRADAITSLNQIAQAQERWRANAPLYAASTLGVANPSSGYYTLTVTVPSAASATSFTATATAAGAQLKDTRCATIILTAASGTYAYDATPAGNANRCWNR